MKIFHALDRRLLVPVRLISLATVLSLGASPALACDPASSPEADP
jgi:hypothetical protein